jgi:hypothetical protein
MFIGQFAGLLVVPALTGAASGRSPALFVLGGAALVLALAVRIVRPAAFSST